MQKFRSNFSILINCISKFLTYLSEAWLIKTKLSNISVWSLACGYGRQHERSHVKQRYPSEENKLYSIQRLNLSYYEYMFNFAHPWLNFWLCHRSSNFCMWSLGLPRLLNFKYLMYEVWISIFIPINVLKLLQ